MTGHARADATVLSIEPAQDRHSWSFVVTGMLAGITGLTVFLVMHALWIVPIWFVAPAGLVLALLGGITVARAFTELRPHLPRRPLTAPSIIALMTVVLAPSAILAELREPMFIISVDGDAVPAMAVSRMATLFVLELVVVSTAVGALIGWLLGRSRRTSAAMAIAGLMFALGPGHNLPFLGGTTGVWLGYILLIVPASVAAVVLVEVAHRIAGPVSIVRMLDETCLDEAGRISR